MILSKRAIWASLHVRLLKSVSVLYFFCNVLVYTFRGSKLQPFCFWLQLLVKVLNMITAGCTKNLFILPSGLEVSIRLLASFNKSQEIVNNNFRQ